MESVQGRRGDPRMAVTRQKIQELARALPALALLHA